MQYIIIAVVMFFLGWKLGRKYQDFQDIMIARRIAKMVELREQVSKERQDWDRWAAQDNRLGKLKYKEAAEIPGGEGE